tara:strand:- start:108 stop:359 length:252 start_codon:yes stop_codon:yes gene_type:complete
VPVYEYECDVCRIRFERKHGFDEEPVVECPECRGQTQRVFYSAPVIFKGSGFYVTDSRKSGDVASEKVKKELPAKGKPKESSE